MSQPSYRKSEEDSRRTDYNPCHWGHHMWESLHYISLGYPRSDPSPPVRRAAQDLMRNLVFLLPCSLCREHLAEMYEASMPLSDRVFQDRDSLGRFIVELRDRVKTRHVLSPCEASAWPRHTFKDHVQERLRNDRTCRTVLSARVFYLSLAFTTVVVYLWMRNQK